MPLFIPFTGGHMDRKIVGFVGPIASGKGAAIEVFKEAGYVPSSLSDRVREEARRRVADDALRSDFDRSDLQNIGNDLRATEGGATLAKRTWALVQGDGSLLVAIDSIRNPEEIHFLRTLPGWRLLIGITASQRRRYQNMISRARATDPKTWEEFKALEERDRGAGETALGQQVDACLALADVRIENESTLFQFQGAIREFMREHGL
jgi:dephospho-CoA kinase